MLVFLASLILSGCSGGKQEGKRFTLPSGHIIRVMAVAPLQYTNGSPPSLMFQYQTDLKIPTTSNESWSDLIKEVNEIWSVLRQDADNGHFTSAIISAREVPHGLLIKKSNGWNFVYQIGPDHQWHRLKTL
ncbi:MAG TPA: hypothetical protein VGN44_10530 [Candidatus Angelobacter sp.]